MGLIFIELYSIESVQPYKKIKSKIFDDLKYIYFFHANHFKTISIETNIFITFTYFFVN